jgi:hypothetical protein
MTELAKHIARKIHEDMYPQGHADIASCHTCDRMADLIDSAGVRELTAQLEECKRVSLENLKQDAASHAPSGSPLADMIRRLLYAHPDKLLKKEAEALLHKYYYDTRSAADQELSEGMAKLGEEAIGSVASQEAAQPMKECEHGKMLIEPCESCGRESLDLTDEAGTPAKE